MIGLFHRLFCIRRKPVKRVIRHLHDRAEYLECRMCLSLTIEPIWDASLTSKTNHVAIENSINAAIQQFQTHVDSTQHVKVIFQANTAQFRAINVTYGGTNYTQAPRVDIDAPTSQGGAKAIARAEVSGGKVTKIIVTYGGFGYTAKPNVRLVRTDGKTGDDARYDLVGTYGFGANLTNRVAETYASYRDRINSQTNKSNDDITAFASLPAGPNLPAELGGGSFVELQYPLAKLLGYTNLTLPTITTADAAISLNINAMNVIRSGQPTGKPDLESTVLHELEEVLGGGSALDSGANSPAIGPAIIKPLDLYRYSGKGIRSYTYNLATQAFFSIDKGATTLAQFNQTAGGDFGDWYSPHDRATGRLLSSAGPQVQDAQATVGSSPNLGVELRRLDVLGYTLNSHLPDLVLTASNNVNGTTTTSSGWTWKLHVANSGTASATFTNNQAILADNLPSGDIDYGSISITGVHNVTGQIDPSMDVTHNLVLLANGPVVLAPGGSFDVEIPVLVAGVGTYTNPRSQGTDQFKPVAQVDPNGVIAETSVSDNSASNTVTVTAANSTSVLTIADTPDLPTSLPIHGTAINDGDKIEVIIKDSQSNQTRTAITTVAGKAWSVSGIDISGLANGWIEYSVSELTPTFGSYHLDGYFVQDVAFKGVHLAFTNTPDITNSNKTNVSASGIGAVNGDLIRVFVVDQNNIGSSVATTRVSNGVWSVTGMNALGLADGPVRYSVLEQSVSFLFEGYQPTRQVFAQATKNSTSNLSTLTITSAPNIIATNQFNVSAQGTGENGAIIEVTISDNENATITKTTSVSNGVWSVSGIDASALNDGSVVYMVSETTLTGDSNTVDKFAVKTVLPQVIVNASSAILRADAMTLLITGAGFDPNIANDQVMLSNGTATVTQATSTSLTVSVSGLIAGPLLAAVAVGESISDTTIVATVVPVVTVSNTVIWANSTSLIIHGFGFSSTVANNILTLSGQVTGTISSASNTQLTVTNLVGLFPQRLFARVDSNGQSSDLVQVVIVQPVVTASTLNLADSATTLTIHGFGLAGAFTVQFSGGATGTVFDATSTSITVNQLRGLKPGALTAVVSVGGISSGVPVQVATVIGTPKITASQSLLPASATTLLIRGSNFSPVAANNTVTFQGGVTGTVSVATATQLTITNLTGLLAGNLYGSVTVAGLSSGSVQLAVIQPVVTVTTTSVTNHAASLTINGKGFSSNPSSNTVVFNGGAVGQVTSATSTQLVVTGITGLAVGSLTAIVRTSGISSGNPVQVATVAASGPPTVTASSGKLSATATSLVLHGSGFAGVPSSNVVTFSGGATGTVSAATATQLTITNVKGLIAGKLNVAVKVGSLSSSTIQVATVVPVITSKTANLANNATSLTINGFGFSSVAANNTISLTAGAIGHVTSATSTILTVTGLTGLAIGNLNAVVTSNSVSTTSAVQIATVIGTAPPIITSSTAILPATATTIVINGSGFAAAAGSNVVTFSGGVTGTVTKATGTQLTVSNVTGLTAGPLSAKVTLGSGSSATVLIANVVPVLTASTFNLSNVTTSFAISGVGFSTTPANNIVHFSGGATGTVTAATSTTLTVTGVSGLAVGNLTATVTTNSISSASTQVATVVAAGPPTIVSASDVLKANATTLVIHGSGFAAAPASNTVTFSGGATGTISTATGSQLTITNLHGLVAGVLTVTVAVGGFTSSGVQIANVQPVVTANTASLANNASTLIINGFGFSTTPSANTVQLSGGATGTVTAATYTQLTVTGLTGLAVGNLTATVTSNSVSIPSAVLVATVTAAGPPVITANTAMLLANATTLILNGSGFAAATTGNIVSFSGGVTGTVSRASGTQLTISSLTGLVAGNLSVTVTVNGFESTSVQVATVQPVITSSTANLNYAASSFTISGFGFSTTAAANIVQFSGGATGTVALATATSLTITGLTGQSLGVLTATVTSNSVGSAPAVQVATVVVAPGTLNVSVTTTNVTTSLSMAHHGYGQSFVPTVSGLLTQINVLDITRIWTAGSQTVSSASATMQLYQGGVISDTAADNFGEPAGALLDTESFTLSAGTNSIIFSHPPMLLANQSYVWRFIVSGPAQIVDTSFSKNNLYTQGDAVGISGQGYDLPFQIYISA